MKILIYSMLFFAVVATMACSNMIATPSETNADYVNGKKMVWSDEFDYSGLPDENKWSYDVGDACDLPAGCGWGNSELQYYTEKELNNARVNNGHLIIEAHQQIKHNSKYTSARLVTKGKGDFQYGRIEVKAKLSNGIGTWPAIWMLPTDWEYGGWPASGEIDIMEHVGYLQDSIFGTVHTTAFNHLEGTQKGDQIFKPTAEKDFHLYGIDWDEQKIDFFVDDELYFTFNNEDKTTAEWPFDKPFHIILNLAVGGHWGGKMGIDEKIWPQKLIVDYVRVYQKESITK